MAEWRGGFGVDSDDDVDESGEPGQQGQRQALRDGLVFLLDCREQMFRVNSAGRSLVQLNLKCAKKVLKQKALTSERDLVAVVAFGTGKSTSEDLKHVTIVQPLEQSSAERVKQLSRLSKMDKDELAGEFGQSSNSVSLADAVWTCQNLFSGCSLKLGYRRLFLFTNDDSPHSADRHLQAQLRTKIQDLQQTDVELILIPQRPTSTGAEYFDCHRFYYDNLLTEDERIVSGYDLLEDLLSNVESKAATRRAQVRLPLKLAPGLSLSVGLFNLCRKAVIPTAEKLHRDTNERVKRTTRKYLADTAEVLMPTDLQKAVVVAGKKVLFEAEEVKQMRRLADTGLTLIAFYPLKALKNHHHLKPASFIYPDENAIEGSTCLFTSLLRTCLNKGRFALCACTPRSNAATSLAALVPQDEVRNSSGIQTVPPGFHLVMLPYSDDIRKLSLPSTEKAEEDEIQAAKALTQRLVMPHWSPEDHSNPALQTYYAHLEAMALDKSEPKPFEDTTVLSEKALKRAARAIEEFKEVCGLNDVESAGGPTRKRPKSDEPVDIEAEAKAGRLAKLTVPVLKEAATNLRLKPASQRKQDLIDAICSHFS